MGEAGPIAWDQGLGGGFWEDEHEQAGCGGASSRLRPRGLAAALGASLTLARRLSHFTDEETEELQALGPQSSGSHHCARRAVGAELSPLLGSVQTPDRQCCFLVQRSRSLLSARCGAGSGPARAFCAAVLPPERVLPARTLPSRTRSFPLFRVIFLWQQHRTERPLKSTSNALRCC